MAYIPIGLGGKSGVLKVQMVPGEIPFLIPACFLACDHTLLMALRLTQQMIRLPTGHVSWSLDMVSLFQQTSCVRSQGWTIDEATGQTVNHAPADAHPKPWVRWRRLLLRLLVSICSQATRILLQVAKQPQLRQVITAASKEAREAGTASSLTL